MQVIPLSLSSNASLYFQYAAFMFVLYGLLTLPNNNFGVVLFDIFLFFGCFCLVRYTMSKSTALVFILFFGIVIGIEQPVSYDGYPYINSVCIVTCMYYCMMYQYVYIVDMFF